VTAVALRLLEEYAPARPVRLLGVRMAALSFGEGGECDGAATADTASAVLAGHGEDQLALPV
jgi:hypothetical protein